MCVSTVRIAGLELTFSSNSILLIQSSTVSVAEETLFKEMLALNNNNNNFKKTKQNQTSLGSISIGFSFLNAYF